MNTMTAIKRAVAGTTSFDDAWVVARANKWSPELFNRKAGELMKLTAELQRPKAGQARKQHPDTGKVLKREERDLRLTDVTGRSTVELVTVETVQSALKVRVRLTIAIEDAQDEGEGPKYIYTGWCSVVAFERVLAGRGTRVPFTDGERTLWFVVSQA